MTLQSDTRLEAIPEPRVGDLTSEGKRTATALCVGVQRSSAARQNTKPERIYSFADAMDASLLIVLLADVEDN